MIVWNGKSNSKMDDIREKPAWKQSTINGGVLSHGKWIYDNYDISRGFPDLHQPSGWGLPIPNISWKIQLTWMIYD